MLALILLRFTVGWESWARGRPRSAYCCIFPLPMLTTTAARSACRAFTATPYPIDLGCERLLSADRNPLTKIAEKLGFTIDDSPPPWGQTDAGRVDDRKRGTGLL
jgi:hypothetical protein